MANLFENDFGPKRRQQLHEIAHVRFSQQRLTPPGLKLHFDVVEAVLMVNFIVDGEASVLVAHPLLVLGVDEDLEHIDEEAGVHDGGVVGEFLFEEWRECPGLLLARPPSGFCINFALGDH